MEMREYGPWKIYRPNEVETLGEYILTLSRQLLTVEKPSKDLAATSTSVDKKYSTTGPQKGGKS